MYSTSSNGNIAIGFLFTILTSLSLTGLAFCQYNRYLIQNQVVDAIETANTLKLAGIKNIFNEKKLATIKNPCHEINNQKQISSKYGKAIMITSLHENDEGCMIAYTFKGKNSGVREELADKKILFYIEGNGDLRLDNAFDIQEKYIPPTIL